MRVAVVVVSMLMIAQVAAHAGVHSDDRKQNEYKQHILELRRWRQYSDEDQKRELKKLSQAYLVCMDEAMSAADRERCAKASTLASCAEDRGCRVVDPREVAREVIAQLTFPDATPIFGPDPDVNQAAPGKLVVGFPYWLTVAGADHQSTSATSQGLTLRLDARRTKVVFEMGDGRVLTCTETRSWPGERAGFNGMGKPKSSPVCGHSYGRTGEVVIRATMHWEVTWHGGGMSGVDPLEFTDEIALDVVELHTVVR